MKKILFLTLMLVLAAVMAVAETQTWTFTNNVALSYTNELMRLPVTFTDPYDADKLVVTEDGKEIATQIEVLDGERTAVKRANIWVCTTIATGGKHSYVVTTDGTPTAVAAPLVKVTQDDTAITLDNDVIAVKLPAKAVEGALPGPITGIKVGTGALLGGSSWQTALKLKEFTATVAGDGKLFAEVKLHYTFEPTDAIKDPTADFYIRLAPGQLAATVEEAHQMAPGDSWTFTAAAGWAPTAALVRGWARWDTTPARAPVAPVSGFGKPKGAPDYPGPKVVGAVTDESVRLLPFQPNARTGRTLISLQPRWTTGVDAGWFAYLSDSNPLPPPATVTPGVKAPTYTQPKKVVGIVAARAGKWDWPYDNLIQLRLSGAGTGEFMCPTTHGRRFFLLTAGGAALVDKATDLVNLMSVAPLDKMANQYNLAGKWVANPADTSDPNKPYLPLSPFTGKDANPTGLLRTRADNILAAVQAKNIPPVTLAALGEYQSVQDPDYYSGYNNHWSPIQTNYSMNMVRLMILRSVSLKEQANFKEICANVEKLLRAELDNTITMPGGAMQTSPGNTYLIMLKWDQLASVCRDNLGFDPHEWPQLRAAANYLLHITVPGNFSRVLLASGDTDYIPTDAQIQALTKNFSVNVAINTLKTEELPGYGVIFHDQPGTVNESFLAFKAGPNRANMHGDQLSIHYAALQKGQIVDHASGSNPRAEQEWMHNRLSFLPNDPAAKFANMDGYERLIAFKTGTAGDVAVGQVESSRLRSEPQYPNEIISQDKGTVYPLDKPLVYRRTMVMVKPDPNKGGAAYFVVLDQASGPVVKSILNYHTTASGVSQSAGSPIINATPISIFVKSPQPTITDRIFWWHANKSGVGFEQTYGATVSTRAAADKFEMISAFALASAGTAPVMSVIPGGVNVTMPNSAPDRIIFIDAPKDANAKTALIKLTRNGKEEVLLTVGDIDLERSQGKTGLFVPEAGYDLGPIPDWLITQRPSAVVDSSWEK